MEQNKIKFVNIIPSRDLITKKKKFLIFYFGQGVALSIFFLFLFFILTQILFTKITFILFLIIVGGISLLFAVDPEGYRIIDRLIKRQKYLSKAQAYRYQKF